MIKTSETVEIINGDSGGMVAVDDE